VYTACGDLRCAWSVETGTRLDVSDALLSGLKHEDGGSMP
jgi:hypothetical protein